MASVVSIDAKPTRAYDADEDAKLEKMRRRFRAADEAEMENRERAIEAIRFYYGDQWSDDIEQQRRSDGRPCFTLNKLPSILKQVINDTKRNPPSIQINPVADGADESHAEIRQGLARHVETNSDAPSVYESAFVYLLVGGYASWRVCNDFLPKSFDQELYIKSIANPFSVYWDPDAQERDRSDARYCFITTDLDPDTFKEQFPNSELAGLDSFQGLGNTLRGWGSSSNIRIVEYFDIEKEKVDLVKLVDGRTVWEDELKKGDRILKKGGKPVYREDERNVVWTSKCNGFEYLEEPERLPIDEIPVMSIFGNEMIVDDRRRYKGMVYDLIEAQKLFNYNSSAIGESMALGSKANWLATIEQIEQFMELWKNSNQRAMAVLPYKNVQGVAPPQKIVSEPPIQAMSLARTQSADDLRSISGVYDQTQGPSTFEESGRAILERRHQTAQGNLDYTSALAVGVRKTARVLNKYFPHVYDTARICRINGVDQQQKQVMVHGGKPDSVPAMLPPGIKGVFDLSVGTYDVTVSIGISDEDKRQQAVGMLLALIQANPAIAPMVMDLLVNEMDIPGKSAFVERFRRALPPNLQDPQTQQNPAAVQAQAQQLQQQNQALMQKIQQLVQVIQGKQVEAQSRENVARMKLQGEQIRAAAGGEVERMKAQSNILAHAADKHFDALHDHVTAGRNQQHEAAMSQLDQVHSMIDRAHAAQFAPAQPPPQAPQQQPGV